MQSVAKPVNSSFKMSITYTTLSIVTAIILNQILLPITYCLTDRRNISHPDAIQIYMYCVYNLHQTSLQDFLFLRAIYPSIVKSMVSSLTVVIS